MNDKVYPLVYYIFPFTAIENYTIEQENSFYTIIADVHITDDVKIIDSQVGLYNLKVLKSDIDLVNDCILKNVLIYCEDLPMTFNFNVAGSSFDRYNGMGSANIPTNDKDRFSRAIQKVIDSKSGYIIFSMIFGDANIMYRINILSN